MTVRAKFIVGSVTHTVNGGSVQLRPVTSGSPENETFYKFTPNGLIDLATVNEDALGQFVPGKQFYVDFTEATDPVAG